MPSLPIHLRRPRESIVAGDYVIHPLLRFFLRSFPRAFAPARFSHRRIPLGDVCSSAADAMMYNYSRYPCSKPGKSSSLACFLFVYGRNITASFPRFAIVFINSKFLERHSEPKHCRVSAYSKRKAPAHAKRWAPAYSKHITPAYSKRKI